MTIIRRIGREVGYLLFALAILALILVMACVGLVAPKR